MTDLPTKAFLQLRRRFFSDAGEQIPFVLREKRSTQDDPFDEFLATDVLADLDGITCTKASGPLITPDMVLYRPDRCVGSDLSDLADDIDRIVGIEVKKLERTAQGAVARRSGLDYNTTPPCGRIRVYDAAGTAVDIRGFYLFVCLEQTSDDASSVVLTALCLVDGNILNEDFELYLSITGEREKRIGLGTYGDGADRARPMVIFANPLGVREFDGVPTLIHPNETLRQTEPDLQLVYRLHRSLPEDGTRSFYCYRHRADVPTGWKVVDLVDPFPTPVREIRTKPRGRFKLPFHV